MIDLSVKSRFVVLIGKWILAATILRRKYSSTQTTF